MASEIAMLAPVQQHGALACAVKWAFKTYVRARDTISEVVAEARVETESAKRDVPTEMPAPVAGGSDDRGVRHGARRTSSARGEPLAATIRRSSRRLAVRWLSATGAEEHPIGDLPTLLERDDGFVWLDITTFDEAAERILADVFKFHPLAIRDCREPGHVPKVHAYDDHLFIVLHAPERGPTGLVQHRELNQFIGSRYLVTVHEPLETAALDTGRLETSAVLARIEAGRINPATPAELSYSIVTRLSTRMESIISELASSVARLENAVSTHERHLLRPSRDGADTIVDEMFELRHALLAIETIADQNRVVYARTAALAPRLVSSEQRRFIADVEDQFSRARRLCRGQKELLQGVLDFSRTRTTAKMDLAMSRLALISAVALPVSVISSIYGMNLFVFEQTRLDVLFLALGMMSVMTLAMLNWARRQGWW